MWQEIYLWLEQYSGVSYDFDEDIKKISGDFAFLEPYEWTITIESILEGMSDAINVIEEYGSLLPEEFPDKDSLKRQVSTKIISSVLDNINHVKKQLNIDIISINKYHKIMEHVNGLSALLDMLNENNIDDIIKHKMLEKADEENDNILTEDFSIHTSDLTSMSFTVSSIRESHYSDDDE